MTQKDSDTVLARLDRPTVEERTRIAVVADPHVSDRATGTAMVYHRSAERLRTAFSDAEARGVDAVISAGDLTKDGAPWEYDLFDEILADLNLPFFSVPGNHDAPKAPTTEYEYGDQHDTPPISRFEERYTPSGTLPFVERVGGIDVVGINTATMPNEGLKKTHDGEVAEAEIEWLETTLPDLKNPVILMHHNTPAMFEQFHDLQNWAYPEMGTPPILRNPQPVLDTLTDNEVPLVITGHLHNLGVAETGSVREVTSPATGSFPQAYLIFEFDEHGTTVKYIPVTDTEGATEAHHARRTDSETSAGFAAFAAIRLARLPLHDDRDPRRAE